MILAIEVGNRHMVLGCLEETKQSPEVPLVFRLKTDRTATEFEYAMKLRQSLELAGVDPHGIAGAVIASVVPQLNATLQRAVELSTGAATLMVGPGVKTGLKIALDDPGTIAPNFVATAVAARERYPMPCIIIDMGTATSVTVLDAAGTFLGGAILPGMAVSLEALTKEASLLPAVDLIPPKRTIATNTTEAMKAGAVYGQAGAIDGILDRFTQALETEEVCFVCTGDEAAQICENCRHTIEFDETLSLRGMALIWQKTKQAKKTGREKGK